MPTSRRAINVTVAPPEWHSRCRNSEVRPIPHHSRHADRSWWREYVGLIEEGYIDCPGSWSERHAARHMRCRCGDDMDLRAFDLVGSSRRVSGVSNLRVMSHVPLVGRVLAGPRPAPKQGLPVGASLSLRSLCRRTLT